MQTREASLHPSLPLVGLRKGRCVAAGYPPAYSSRVTSEERGQEHMQGEACLARHKVIHNE